MSLKSWGLELWDQIDKVFQYSNQGLEQIEVFYRTVSDIHKIYISLVKKHKALVVPTSNKTKLVLENSTYNASFVKFLTCMNEQASIYETQSDDIRENVINPIKSFVEGLKNTIIAQNNEYIKFKNNLENHKKILDRAWSKYYQAYVNKKRAEANYNKIKDDKTIPRVDIERVQGVANLKNTDFDKMRGEYASQLQIFNTARSVLYLQDLPKLCSELELYDRKRAEITAETGLTLVTIQKKHLQGTSTCNDAVADAMRLIDFKVDSVALVCAYKTTILFPSDVVFVDLDKSKSETFNAADFPGILQQGGKIEKNDSAKSLFGGVGMKGIEAKEMLAEQVKLRLDEVSNAIKRVEKSLSGLKTLGDTYSNNPSMGDKSSLEPQIDVIERQLMSLNEMAEVVTKHFQTIRGDTNSINKQPSRMTSDTGADSDGSFDEDEEDDFDGQQVQTGTDMTNVAKVLYDFDATDEQQLTVVTDMMVRVLTYDDLGSGWTLVQSMKEPAKKGYVPTNYIKMV